MSVYFEELDWRPTPIGPLSLRRRRELSLGIDVYEIKLGEEFLMSSLFTASEVALARLALANLSRHRCSTWWSAGSASVTPRRRCSSTMRVGTLIVVEMLEPVIDWHRAALLPLGPELTGDARCRLVEGDFFALAASRAGFDPEAPGRPLRRHPRRYRSLPEALLDDRSTSFYRPDGPAPACPTPPSRRHLRAVVERGAGCRLHRSAGRPSLQTPGPSP
jgi:hypothetical protein